MFGVFSLIWYVRINFFWIVRQDVAIVTLYLPDSSLGCFICVLPFFFNNDERSELLF